MTALVVVCAVAGVLAAVVVVDALRAHATLLRRLHRLDPEGRAEWEAPPNVT